MAKPLGRQFSHSQETTKLRTRARAFDAVAAAVLLGCLLIDDAHAIPEVDLRPIEHRPVAGAPRDEFDTFLKRLMAVESGGRDDAANPRSSALGPFQFIRSTFLDLVRRHFAVETDDLTEDEVLELRVNRPFARHAAALYSRENLAVLTGHGLIPTFGHLRLAFLVGPTAAVRLIRALPDTPAAEVLGSAVIKANPFMSRLSASGLIARAARDISDDRNRPLGVAPPPRERPAVSQPLGRTSPRAIDVWTDVRRPRSTVSATCNRKLASCRRWITLREAKQRDEADRKRRTRRAGSRGDGRS
jgi:hypothetical protein